MNLKVSMQYKTRVMDAKTGLCIKDNPWKKNLVLDAGLNGLAKNNSLGLSTCPANSFLFAKVGSGTDPVRIPGNSVQFSQTGTALTSDSSFFTSDMVGAIFKYGTDTTGQEVYITAFTSATAVTVDTSASHTNEPGVVWMVQQTALQTPLHTTNTYQTASGDCQTSFSGTNNEIANLKRTFVIPQQGSSYTVNEIGWSPIGGSNGSGNICGRDVLSSSDVVGTSNFYVIVIQLSFTFSPGVPTAVADVGTNINTAGNAMVESWSIKRVDTDGSTITNTTDRAIFDSDSSNSQVIGITTATYTQNSGIVNASALTGTAQVQIQTAQAWVNDGAVRGKMTLTGAGSVATTGQTLYGLSLSNTSSFTLNFDVKLTTPVTLPSGTWTITVVFQIIFGRTLDNA